MKIILTKTGKIIFLIIVCILAILVIWGGCKIVSAINEKRTIDGLEVPNNDY